MSNDSADSVEPQNAQSSPSILTRTWRYLPFKKYDPYLKIALNEVALASVNHSGTPIVWICGWDKNCINVGQQQNINDVVNVKEAKKRNITIVRRQGGGGAMYLDSEGEITWSVIIPNELLPRDVNDVYKIYCEKICDALEKLGIEAYHKPINDVMTTLGKISGSTIKKERNATYVSGTLIYAVNMDMVRTLLQPENDKTKDKRVPEKFKPITSVSMEAEKSREETIQALSESLLDGVTFKVDNWSSQELADAEILVEKYKSNEWLRYNG